MLFADGANLVGFFAIYRGWPLWLWLVCWILVGIKRSAVTCLHDVVVLDANRDLNMKIIIVFILYYFF